MGQFRTKVRSVLTLAALGGAAGGTVGIVWALVFWRGLLDGGLVTYFATRWGLFGAFTLGGFASLLAVTRSIGALQHLTRGRGGAFGGAAGAAFPSLHAFASFGDWVPLYPSDIGLGALLGALMGSGAVTIAQRARQAELKAANPTRRDGE